MDGITYGGISEEFGNMSWYMNNGTKRSASIVLPFPLPEIPSFFTSWTFLALCTLSIVILGLLIACCKILCCKISKTNNDKSIPLIDESLSKEPPLEISVPNILKEISLSKSLSKPVKSRKSKVKIGINTTGNVKDQGEDSIELCRVSYKSTACQTSLNQISNKSQSTLKEILKTLSGNINKKQSQIEPKAPKEDFACQTSLDKGSKLSLSALERNSKTLQSNITKNESNKQEKSEQPITETIDGHASKKDDFSCQASLDKLPKMPRTTLEQGQKSCKSKVAKEERDEKRDKSDSVEQVDIPKSGKAAKTNNTSDSEPANLDHGTPQFETAFEEALWQKVNKAVALAIQESTYSAKRSKLTLTESILSADSKDSNYAFIQSCTACGKPPPSGKKLLLCKQCRVAEYCNKDCQLVDWPKHKTFCILSAASGKNTDLL